MGSTLDVGYIFGAAAKPIYHGGPVNASSLSHSGCKGGAKGAWCSRCNAHDITTISKEEPNQDQQGKLKRPVNRSR